MLLGMNWHILQANNSNLIVTFEFRSSVSNSNDLTFSCGVLPRGAPDCMNSESHGIEQLSAAAEFPPFALARGLLALHVLHLGDTERSDPGAIDRQC
mmetsp:Transcript_16526/g.29356  ORF Transcript_16526/g.29356 Transcript_16526/m.29356 type:complete len:97 (-) Transcript_16526:809-1099(-)